MSATRLPLLDSDPAVEDPAAPPTPVATAGLLQRAEALIGSGRLTAARTLLAAVARQGAATADLALARARLALAENRPAAAREELDAAIAAEPAHAALRKLRAQIHAALDNMTDSALDAAEAVMADPRDPQAKALLGGVLLALGQPTDAAACLQEAVAGAPGCAAYHRALAAAQDAAGDWHRAAQTLDGAIRLLPRDTALRRARVLHAFHRSTPEAALEQAQQARRDGSADDWTIGIEGYLLARCGKLDAAMDAYLDSQRFAVPQAANPLMATAVPRVPLPVIRALYGCNAAETPPDRSTPLAPPLLEAAIRACMTEAPGPWTDALDLGCEDGTMGRPVARLDFTRITGVDAASNMLARCKALGIYADLRDDDLLAVLLRPDAVPRQDLIVAAGTFRYFGVLAPLLAGAASCLRPGGLLAFTLETSADASADAPWTLGQEGWFRHDRDYVRRSLAEAGFDVVACRPEATRLADDGRANGLLAVGRRRHGT